MAAAAAAVVEEVVVTKCIDQLCEVARYMINYNEIVRDLEDDNVLKTLSAKLVDAKNAVQRAINNNQEIRKDAQLWIEVSERTQKAADELLKGIDRSACYWCMGQYNLNCLDRYVVAKKAESLTRDIKKMIADQTPKVVSTEPPPPPLTRPHGYVDLDSRKEYAATLKRWLVDEEKLVIGVHGQEGVGKTMVVENLAYDIQEVHFTFIAIIRGGGDWRANLFKIQERIGERLWLTSLKNVQDLEERRLSIHKRLSNAWEKVLIIIDQVDERIDANMITNLIGIPRPETTSNFRIMIVSRKLEVCTKMGTHMNLEVGPLSQAESLYLFDKFETRSQLPPFLPLNSEVDPRRRISSRNAPWLPGQLKAYVSALHKLIVQIDQSPSWNLMLPAVAFHIEHSHKVEQWKWLISMEAELQSVWYLYIWGLAKKAWLYQKTNYGAYFVYKFNSEAKGFDKCHVEFTIVIGGKVIAEPTPRHLGPRAAASRDDGWMEIEMGRFYNKGDSSICLEVREKMDEVEKTGLIFRGIELRRLDKNS